MSTASEQQVFMEVSPVENASIISQLFFFWISPLIKLGSQRPLEESDVFPLNKSLQSNIVFKEIMSAWALEVLRKGKNAYFGNALVTAHGRLFYSGNACLVFYMGITVIQPYFVQAILNYVDRGETNLIGITNGVGIALLLGAISVMATVTMNYSFYIFTQAAIVSRLSAILIIFNKSLRLSSAAKSKHTTGEIVTLMSVDSERIMTALLVLSWLFWGPIVITIAMCLLIAEVQFSAIAAAGSMVIVTILQHYITKLSGQTRQQFLKYTDERVKLVNETLQGIRVVKLYAWEEPTKKRIEDIRRKEMDSIAKFQLLKLVNTTSLFLAPLLVAFSVFISYSATGGKLGVGKVYTVYAILNIIRMPVTVIPMAFAAWQDLLVTLQRITQFLLLEEVEQQGIYIEESHEDKGMKHGSTKPADDAASGDAASCSVSSPSIQSSDVNVTDNVTDVCVLDSLISPDIDVNRRRVLVDIRHADFTWSGSLGTELGTTNSVPEEADEAECGGGLRDISLTLRQGDFVAVVGSVGSGKSSLIAAILGQMRRTKGYQKLHAKVAYVCQEHWIQNRTLRDNVLFDSPLDEQRYADVLDASELSKDILSLPHADETEIGEKGINLSGGQKARVSIARALYSNDTDVFIFDDPLAAVDAHVGKAIFENAFCKMLNGKTRLVVLSSNYHFLPTFDRVAVVLDGCLVACDSYANVVAKFPQFRTLNSSNSNSVNDLVSAVEEHEIGSGLECGDSADQTGVEKGTVLEEFRQSEEKDGTAVSPSDWNEESDSKRVVKKVLPPSSSFSVDVTAASLEDTKASPPVGHANTNRSYKFRDNLAKVNSIREMAQSSRSLMGKEDREKGAVTSSTYFQYFTGSVTNDLSSKNEWIGQLIFTLTIVVFALAQCVRVLADYWVGFWSADVDRASPRETEYFYIRGYIIIVVVCSVVGLLRSFLFVRTAIASSRNVHSTALASVLSAPINLYFDVTPIGRILNRFSKDLDNMDAMLPDTLLQNFQNGMYVLSILIVCVASTYFFAIVLVPLAAVFVVVQSYYRNTSRELKRLESISRSPMYTLFEEVLQGLSTIRAYQRQDVMLQRHFDRCDVNSKCYYIIWIASRWLSLRLDLLCSAVIVSVALIGVIMTDVGSSVDPNLLGLALVYSIQLTGLLQWTVRMMVDTENSMTSVERLLAFINVPSEAASVLPSDPGLDKWPSTGALKISNLSLRYRPGLDPVLRGIYVDIVGGSKVGVCGRTGAGKSSLMLALFRLVEPEDNSVMSIDDVDLMSLGLHCLRSGLTIIPQDPVMFSGTLRYNLDPFSVFSDEEIWTALDRAQLKQDILDKFPNKLEHVVSERGENISLGQRQLLCIARALLRKSKVIVMDEATASVDSITDEKIQRAVRSEFRHCTVLTIAHRLETIADSDLILVMDEGRVAEHGSPMELMDTKDGIFSGLVDELGPDRKEALRAIALHARK